MYNVPFTIRVYALYYHITISIFLSVSIYIWTIIVDVPLCFVLIDFVHSDVGVDQQGAFYTV